MNRPWTREEMIVVLNLYFKIPFAQTKKTNPEVMRTANMIGRTAAAVAMRLGNFGSYDIQLKARNISGLANGGKACEAVWDEFLDDKEKLLFDSERIIARYEGKTMEQKFGIENTVGADRLAMIKTRVNQNFFRQMILANYDARCALTGIDLPELLVASHIIPWAKNKEERLNPQNGICLSSLYDKAFDQGLISFDESCRTLFSARLRKNMNKEYYERYFVPVEHKPLTPGNKYAINPQFLEWHRDCIFDK